MPVYSFGVDSPLKIKISDRDATTYNRVTHEFFEAQFRFMEETHTQYTGREPLKFENVSKRDLKTYNHVGRIITAAIKAFPRPLLEEDLPDDFLVKN